MKAIKTRLVGAFAAVLLTLAACSPPPTATTDTTAESMATPTAAATGEACGGPAGIVCAAATDYCATASDACNVADASGTCTAKPDVCTQNVDPVCGCNGTTYSNACAAAQAGVNVASVGACTAAPATP